MLGTSSSDSPIGASGENQAEFVGFGEQRVGDPVEAGNEIPETEPPAGGKRAARPAIALQKPGETGERRDQGRHDIKGRQGEDGEGAEQDGGEDAPPAAKLGEADAQPVEAVQCLRLAPPAGDRETTDGAVGPFTSARAGDLGGASSCSRRTTRTRLIRRGSASRISKARPVGCSTVSVLLGTRPASETTRPPSVSMSSRSSSLSMGRSAPPDLQRRPGVGIDAAVSAGSARHHLAVMFVGDFTDDLFDHVLDGHQSVDTTELIDNQGHVRSLCPHLQQELQDLHRGGDEQHRADDLGELERLAVALPGERP